MSIHERVAARAIEHGIMITPAAVADIARWLRKDVALHRSERLTASQQQIVDYLHANPGRLVPAREIADALGIDNTKTVHVQLHKIRATGIRTVSARSRGGGIRLDSPAHRPVSA